MKAFILIFSFLTINVFAVDPKIGGTVFFKNSNAKIVEGEGRILVNAKDPKTLKTIAVFNFKGPRFPQAFVITAKNLVNKNSMIYGPLLMEAEFYNKENILVARGVSEKNLPVDLGVKNVQINLGPLP